MPLLGVSPEAAHHRQMDQRVRTHTPDEIFEAALSHVEPVELHVGREGATVVEVDGLDAVPAGGEPTHGDPTEGAAGAGDHDGAAAIHVKIPRRELSPCWISSATACSTCRTSGRTTSSSSSPVPSKRMGAPKAIRTLTGAGKGSPQGTMGR